MISQEIKYYIPRNAARIAVAVKIKKSEVNGKNLKTCQKKIAQSFLADFFKMCKIVSKL